MGKLNNIGNILIFDSFGLLFHIGRGVFVYNSFIGMCSTFRLFYDFIQNLKKRKRFGIIIEHCYLLFAGPNI